MITMQSSAELFVAAPPRAAARRWTAGSARRRVGTVFRSEAALREAASDLLSTTTTTDVKMPSASSSTTTTSSNILTWLQSAECPPDVLPLIVACVGPQTAYALSRVNQHWKTLLDQESTWKVLCVEQYKVSLCLEEELAMPADDVADGMTRE
jgi:hypothetical protein